MNLQTSNSASGRAGAKLLSLAFAVAIVFATLATPAASATDGEYIILSGGPALRKWENLRFEQDQHDRFWGNFIRTARIRMEGLRAEQGDDFMLTWLVYQPGYERRASEDGRPLLDFVRSVAVKYNARLVWVNSGDSVIDYLNKGRDRSSTPISGFEYFGHSNKFCWVLDYSNHISGASKAWLHEEDFRKIRNGIFTADPYIKSWGCHTAESMSDAWYRETKTKMWGAVGKTDYSNCGEGELPSISTPGGRWQR